MRVIPLVCGVLCLLACQPANAGQKSVTFYLDGARIEQLAVAVNGRIDYPLPDSFTPGSLRVKPVKGGSVLRVELVPADRDRRRSRDIARLEERKGELLVRMQAQARREEIFSAAAKSQSGKGLRKTKSNPDPLDSMQQGTEYALAQLDGVYRNKRTLQKSLDAVDHEITVARKGATRARIWLSGGRASVSYLVSSERWTPCYDFRWSGHDASGELVLHARLPHPEKGVSYLVSNGTAAQGLAAKPVSDSFPTLSRFPLTLQSGTRTQEPPSSFAFDALQAGLPPGEAAVFWRGEYLGSGQFSGGAASELSISR